MSDSPRVLMSWQACERAAKAVQALFEGTYSRWEVAGDVRRQQDAREPGPVIVKHVLISKPSPPQNPIPTWEKARQLIDRGDVSLCVYAGGATRAPEFDARMVALQVGPIVHELYLADARSWVTRLVQHTGPAGYWRMLLWRLQAAGALKLMSGAVCVVNRGVEPIQYEPLAVGDERDFFRLARTAYKHPRYRFARPAGEADDTENWPRGMEPEWYPPGCKVYVDPRQYHLWSGTKPPKIIRPDRPVPRRGSWNAGRSRWR
jgi:hypothetical protein